jgi:hypothetical protein
VSFSRRSIPSTQNPVAYIPLQGASVPAAARVHTAIRLASLHDSEGECYLDQWSRTISIDVKSLVSDIAKTLNRGHYLPISTILTMCDVTSPVGSPMGSRPRPACQAFLDREQSVFARELIKRVCSSLVDGKWGDPEIYSSFRDFTDHCRVK